MEMWVRNCLLMKERELLLEAIYCAHNCRLQPIFHQWWVFLFKSSKLYFFFCLYRIFLNCFHWFKLQFWQHLLLLDFTEAEPHLRGTRLMFSASKHTTLGLWRSWGIQLTLVELDESEWTCCATYCQNVVWGLTVTKAQRAACTLTIWSLVAGPSTATKPISNCDKWWWFCFHFMIRSIHFAMLFVMTQYILYTVYVHIKYTQSLLAAAADSTQNKD